MQERSPGTSPGDSSTGIDTGFDRESKPILVLFTCLLLSYHLPGFLHIGCRSSSSTNALAMHPELVSKPRRRTGDPDNDLTHPLLGDEPTLQLMPNPDDVSFPSATHHYLLSSLAMHGTLLM